MNINKIVELGTLVIASDRIISKVTYISKELPTEENSVRLILNKVVNKLGKFKFTIDLGSGEGKDWLKQYTEYLVAVDNSKYVIDTTLIRGYDNVVLYDMSNYKIPDECDSVFMFQSIEHISKQSGIDLLKQVGNRFCIITTPTNFVRYSSASPHLSLWTKNELENLDFKVITLYRPLYGNTLAIKRNWKDGTIV